MSSRRLAVLNIILDLSTTWPPPDPDRVPRVTDGRHGREQLLFKDMERSDAERLQNFKTRQLKDLYRSQSSHGIQRRRPFHSRCSQDGIEGDESSADGPFRGEEAWRNWEGEGLSDFGVDEDVEFYDEDNVPLAQVVRRKRGSNPLSEG